MMKILAETSGRLPLLPGVGVDEAAMNGGPAPKVLKSQ